MTADPTADYLSALAPQVRPIAEHLVAAITEPVAFDAAVKWRQLTFALDGDFDHWVGAISASKRGIALILHFGSLLGRDDFDPSESKYARRITYRSVDDVDDAVIREIVTQAVATLPRFRLLTAR